MGSDGNENARIIGVVLGDRPVETKEKFLERRKRADWLVRGAIAMSILAWVVMFAVWIVMHLAAENEAGIFNVILQVDVPVNPLRATLLPIAYYLLLASLAICVVAFVFNKMRMRRKSDKYRKSIIIIAGVTVIAFVAFVINFGVVW